MYRFGREQTKMITICTSPSNDGKLVQIHVMDDSGNSELLGAVSPNVVRGIGVPIDERNPKSWNAELRISEKLLENIK